MDTIPFAFSIHPGEILLTEFMEPLGLTAYRLAKELHISAPRVNDLVRRQARHHRRHCLAPQPLLRQLRAVLDWPAEWSRSLARVEEQVVE